MKKMYYALASIAAVGAIVWFLVVPAVEEHKRDEELKEKERVLIASMEKNNQDELANRKAVFYCVKAIVRGQKIRSDQVEERLLIREKVPVGCSIIGPVVGKKAAFDIQKGQIISQRDFSLPLTYEQNAALAARKCDPRKGTTGFVFNKVALKQGDLIEREDLGEAEVSEDELPQDAVTSAASIVGKRAKFDKPKLQFIMLHELK